MITRIIATMMLTLLGQANTYASDADPSPSITSPVVRVSYPNVNLELIDFNKNPKILHDGCNTGTLTAGYILPATKAKLVVGIDRDVRKIEQAVEKYMFDTRLRFETSRADCFTPREGFDGILSFYTLHLLNIDQKQTAFKNFSDALRNNGILVALFNVGSKEPRLRTAVNQVIAHERWSEYFPSTFENPIHLANPSEIQTMLLENGFKSRRFEVHTVEKTFASDNCFYNWICEWSQFKNLLGDDHKDFWDDVITAYRILTNQNNYLAPLKYTDDILEIVAAKNVPF